jgi:hypothetical protein
LRVDAASVSPTARTAPRGSPCLASWHGRGQRAASGHSARSAGARGWIASRGAPYQFRAICGRQSPHRPGVTAVPALRKPDLAIKPSGFVISLKCKFAFLSAPTHTRQACDGQGGEANAQGCASRGHFVRLVGLFRFDLLARLEPPPGASALKLERWPTTALRKRAARPNLPRMQGLTAHLLRHHQRWLAISHGPRKAASGRCVGW